jgi:hypothetical protein
LTVETVVYEWDVSLDTEVEETIVYETVESAVYFYSEVTEVTVVETEWSTEADTYVQEVVTYTATVDVIETPITVAETVSVWESSVDEYVPETVSVEVLVPTSVSVWTETVTIAEYV